MVAGSLGPERCLCPLFCRFGSGRGRWRRSTAILLSAFGAAFPHAFESSSSRCRRWMFSSWWHTSREPLVPSLCPRRSCSWWIPPRWCRKLLANILPWISSHSRSRRISTGRPHKGSIVLGLGVGIAEDFVCSLDDLKL